MTNKLIIKYKKCIVVTLWIIIIELQYIISNNSKFIVMQIIDIDWHEMIKNTSNPTIFIGASVIPFINNICLLSDILYWELTALKK